jgi:microcystin degradation protein MlrC
VARIAIGGIQHETNTFSPVLASYADFVAPDAWPGLTRGSAMLDAVAGINLPAAGALQELRGLRHECVPLLWCSAQPSGFVTRDAYERISAALLEDLARELAGGIDGVYLDLHGAMAAEHCPDGDGTLLQRVRALVGERIPVVASLDYHANVSPLMASAASALVSYRTYPHVDMAECGARAARCLHDLLDQPAPCASLQSIDFLVALTAQSTLTEPMRTLLLRAVALERGPVQSVAVTPGFPMADVAECGPAIYACGRDRDAVDAVTMHLAAAFRECEADFVLELHTIEAAVQSLRQQRPEPGRPAILVDTQDNPGAGGNADTMELIAALVESDLERVLAGVICDPAVAAQAHAAGAGATIECDLGAGSGFPGSRPLRGVYRVEALGDGRFTGTGPFYRGARFELGPMALLRLGHVHIAVASRKQQAADRAMFHHLHVEPAEQAVLALKSSVHFRADFGDLADRILIVEAPGPSIADPGRLPFRHLRPGVRLRPAGRPPVAEPPVVGPILGAGGSRPPPK